MNTYQARTQARSILLQYPALSPSERIQADKILVCLFYRLSATLDSLYRYRGQIDGKDIVDLDKSIESLKNLYTIVKDK